MADEYPKGFAITTPEGRGILALLDEFGTLSFVVEAGAGSSIRGTELFNRMMSHYGDEVRAIHCVWRLGFQGSPSTNIDKVNELTAAGMVLKDAILRAWTVTRAAKWGFKVSKVLGQPLGSPGQYRAIDVLLEKEP